MAGYIKQTGGTLWQWDTSRHVSVPDDAVECHFAAEGSSTDYLVEADDDGLCEIPNVLLQSAGRVMAWACDGEHVVASGALRVRPRPKPSDYVYTATEIYSVQSVASSAVAAALAEGISYASLTDLPTIEGVTVVGDLTWEDLTLCYIDDEEIESLFE